MKEFLESKLSGKRVLILGMGAEGKSTHKLLRKLFPQQTITLADRRNDLSCEPGLAHPATVIRQGASYLDGLDDFDVIIKSPGVSLKQLPQAVSPEKLTSQTALFLELFRDRTIGITGTKGKSTTASLTHHILKTSGKDVLLVGNIGLPPFDVLDRINDDTIIVFELSAHQLEGVKVSPHIAVLLNIYQEHLDHFPDYRTYQLAKYNIARWQKAGDHFIYHFNDYQIPALIRQMPLASKPIPYAMDEQIGVHTFIAAGEVFEKPSDWVQKICDLNNLQFLQGRHNRLNILAALSACRAAGVSGQFFQEALGSFKGLEHRMEFVGEFGGVRFYNDSIATIPEAVIYALETIGDVDTLLLGGYDRGIDYSTLTAYLADALVNNIFLTGNAGKRMLSELSKVSPGKHNCKWFDDFGKMVSQAMMATAPGRSCLLSPAAASYDQFMNFEHRGRRFKELVMQHTQKT